MKYTPLLTDTEVAAIQGRLERTTPGPWKQGKQWGSVVAEATPELIRQTGVTREIVEEYGGVPVAEALGKEDREFVIHARDDISALIEERRLLLARLAEMEAGE